MLCVLEARAHGRTMIQHSQAADLKLPALNAAAPSPVQVSGPAGHSEGKPLDHPSVPTLCVKNSFWKEKVHVFTASNQTCLRRVHFTARGVSVNACCHTLAVLAQQLLQSRTKSVTPNHKAWKGPSPPLGEKNKQANKRTNEQPNQTRPDQTKQTKHNPPKE